MRRIAVIMLSALIFTACALNVAAATPTALTFKQISAAPSLDAQIDASYGSPVFDIKATDIDFSAYEPGDSNIEPPTKEEMQPMTDAYNAMRTKGYAVFDETNLYLAFTVNDIAPKASSNSTQYWKSTNIQLWMYVNGALGFPTIAYSGTNEVRIWDDRRSEMDISKIKVKFAENSAGEYTYELVIPWNAYAYVEKMSDVTSFKLGFAQTSQAQGYCVQAFGTPFDHEYEELIPVTLERSNGTEIVTSSGTVPDASKAETGASSEKDSTSSVDSASATGSGVEVADNDSEQTSGDTVVDESGKKNYTLVIVLAVVGAVVIAGGAAAIILLNKKKPGDGEN